MVEKRELEVNGSEDVQAEKKAKLEAIKKPSLSKEALEKAKKALQLQKELKEKLKKLPQLQKSAPADVAATGGAPAAVPAKTSMPPPASVPSSSVPPPSTTTATAPSAPPLVPPSVSSFSAGVAPHGASSVLPPPASGPLAPPAEAFVDPRLSSSALRKLQRRSKPAFDFVEEGEFQRQAEAFRLKARYGRDAAPPPRSAAPPPPPPGATPPPNPNLMPIGMSPNLALGTSREGTPAALETEVEPAENVPDVEWWDRGLLATGNYEADVPGDPSKPAAIKDSKITIYVEHPVPIQPPAEAPTPPPQPLKLTKKELKKLRTQRRQAREKEKQDLIRQGLLEPPKPKVKLSNLYRVLGEQAVLDPTAIELETRKQMAERQQAHEDRNLARMLTPDERRDKKLKKLFDDGLEVITSVYRISRMDQPQNKYKVHINATENHMTGALLMTPDFSLVIVEGCNKATKRYAKLMLRRIDWQAPPPAKTDEDGKAEDDEDMDDDEDDREPNRCDLVWQGLVKEKAFEKFMIEDCRTVEHAQQVLAQHKVPHYWDAAKTFIPGESVPVQLVTIAGTA